MGAIHLDLAMNGKHHIAQPKLMQLTFYCAI